MWLSARLTLIRQSRQPVFLASPDAYGTSRLISRLGDDRPLIWLELEKSDVEETVSIGSKLSNAVQKALGSRLFPRGLPYAAALDLLRANLELLGPLTFAVSRADVAPEVSRAFLDLNRHGSQVVLAGPVTPDELRRHFASGASLDLLVLDQDALRLTEEEALAATPEGTGVECVLRCLETSGGAYELFLAELRERLGPPIDPVPSPTGPRLAEGAELAIDPEVLLDVLVKKGDWIRAAEVAVSCVPEHALEVLQEAGHVYHERGLHRRLWRLLERLPEEMKRQPSMLYRRLSTALRIGETTALRRDVEAYLARHEAPDLRALYADVYLDVDGRRREVRRAYAAEATPFTAYQYGRSLAGAAEGASALREAVRLAERAGRPYEVARNAGTLTARLIDAGAYQEAAYWGAWALEYFDRHELSDAQRRLYILNNWAYARILIGETVGLETLLKDSELLLNQAFPALRTLFRSTLGNYFVAAARPAEALVYYRPNWEQVERQMLGSHGLNMVQALLHLQPMELDAAKEISRRAYILTRDEAWDYHMPALLAQGMALAHTDPEEAIAHLQNVLQREPATLPSPYAVQATLYLAHAKLRLGKHEEARHLIETQPALKGLSATGFRLLAGPANHFAEVLRWCLGEAAPLELNFLGRTSVVYKGEALSVSAQQCDILALLAYHKEGVSPERLLAFLTGDRQSHNALYAALSKLRQKVPISAPPYKLLTAFRADFLEALELLQKGQVRRALELYCGTLLPNSASPEVEELRSLTEESFRQAALNTRDPETLLVLARALEDDFELWEAALRALPKGDPRFPIVRAQATQVFKKL
jgi:hypothetical protein